MELTIFFLWKEKRVRSRDLLDDEGATKKRPTKLPQNKKLTMIEYLVTRSILHVLDIALASKLQGYHLQPEVKNINF